MIEEFENENDTHEGWKTEEKALFSHIDHICGICGHSIDLEQNSIIYVTIFFGAMKNDMSKASHIEQNAT